MAASKLVVFFLSHFLVVDLGVRERELELHVKNKKLVIFVCFGFVRSY